MDRYEDIYGEKLHFKERKFTTDTKHSGCQYTISSRPKSMSNLPPILVAPVLLVTLWFLIQITNYHYITSCITSMVALFVMTLLMMLQGQSKAECVTVIQQIGIQVSQHSSNGWWTKPTSRFIPFTEIKDIIINETFYRVTMIPYKLSLLHYSIKLYTIWLFLLNAKIVMMIELIILMMLKLFLYLQ
jgi:hypothetical protein